MKFSKSLAIIATTTFLGANAHETGNLSRHMQQRLNEADSYERITPKTKLAIADYALSTQLYKSTNYDTYTGVALNVHSDLFASYSFPAFWYERLGRDWLVINPSIFVEGSSNIELSIRLSFIDFIWKLKFTGLKFTPLDLQ